MKQEFKVPELGENVKTATVAKVLISKGATVELEQPVVELETDKAVMEVPSTVSGTVDEVLVKDGDEVEVGRTLFTVSAGDRGQEAGDRGQEAGDRGQETKTESVQQPGREAAPAKLSSAPEHAKASGPIPAAPSVRRFAREIGVDISAVTGSGPHGRISTDDLKAYAKTRGTTGRAPVTVQGVDRDSVLPDLSQWGEVERKPMSKVRRLTAERMARAWASIPHVTQFDKADVTEVEKLRQKYKAEAEQAGGHLTITAVLLKCVAGALKFFPQFNAGVDMERREIVLRSYCNLGIAMDTDRGLVVPVIRGVWCKNLIELAIELSRITAKARAGKLTVDEMQGGCFTITNAGALGGESFTPIINWPEVAILGIGRALTEPRYEKGAFTPRQMLPLSLSYDHRVIDGADGVRFLRWIVEALEDPVKLLWEG